MEDVRRIMKEEVRMDWIELWEERWRKRLEKLQSKAARRGKSKDGAAETGIAIQRSREDGGEENVDDGGDEGDDGGDDDDEGEWDGAGAGWDADRKDGEDVWVHRSDDSDFLKAADTYPPPGSLPRSLPLAQKNNVLGSPTRGGGGEGWTASVTRLMGGMGFGSSPLQPEQINATSSPTTPLSTAGASSTTGSPHPLAAAAVANPYRFASPDSITPSLAALREKRREELERQMDLSDPEGNVGLRCWIERRDAWTGANEEGCVRVGRSKFAEVGYYPLGVEWGMELPSEWWWWQCGVWEQWINGLVGHVVYWPRANIFLFIRLQNPLTASVNEAAYSAIYSKCIKKALPPVVPINLRHIVISAPDPAPHHHHPMYILIW